MAAGYSLKDDLFNRETVTRLATEFDDAGVFSAKPFVEQVMAGLAPRELKARISWIADVLADHLPADFPAAADAIEAALPAPLDPTLTDDDFGHFIHAPLGVYVENHGIAVHSARSLDLLKEITKRFSMEFSIRAFLNAHETETLERMQDWAGDDNYHVRRLVSEGTRPKLPWGQSVGLIHDQTLPLLDRLYADQTRYVVRSVANHLNDITKLDPERVLERLAGWQNAGAQDSKELAWMTKHALRGLVKAGHVGALAHLGYRPDAPVTVTDFAIAPDDLQIGDAAEVRCTLKAEVPTPLIVDYVIDYVKANGSLAPKVSKFKVLDLKPGKATAFKKKHVFKGDATTFKLYPGAHRIHLQINGQIVASQPFMLN